MHNKTLYLTALMVLCSTVTFAAQVPVTPDVAQENMLVPSSSPRTNNAGEEEKTHVPLSVPAAPATLTPETTSYKPVLPTPAPLKADKKSATSAVAAPASPVSGKVEAAKAGVAPEADHKAADNAPGNGVVIDVPAITPSLGRLTFLRGQLEESKLRVAIAEQDARLRQINAPPAPVAPAMQTMPPQIPLDMLLDSSRATKSAPKTSFTAPRSRKSGVVSIQGVNGLLSATIATKNGTITVKAGDSFGGGKIESIAYNQVLVRYAKKTAPLPFVE